MKLENKKIAFLGDSITAGSGTTGPDKIFHQLIKQKYNLAQAYNCGIGGTRIARQTNPTISCITHDLYFALRAQVMPRDVDAVVVFGGTNDYGHGDAKFGTPDSTDEYTFYGALNSLCTQLKSDYPNSKIIFLTPLHRVSDDTPCAPEGKLLSDYVNAIVEIAENYGFSVIDLFGADILDPYNPELVPDGLHPSDKGHEIMADYIAKELLKI